VITTTNNLRIVSTSDAVLTLPSDAAGRMASLDLLMSSREDAYDEMRRLVPGLAWSAAERVELTVRQRVATERFEELNRQVRGFRSL
jgi:hypothetical protein